MAFKIEYTYTDYKDCKVATSYSESYQRSLAFARIGWGWIFLTLLVWFLFLPSEVRQTGDILSFVVAVLFGALLVLRGCYVMFGKEYKRDADCKVIYLRWKYGKEISDEEIKNVKNEGKKMAWDCTKDVLPMAYAVYGVVVTVPMAIFGTSWAFIFAIPAVIFLLYRLHEEFVIDIPIFDELKNKKIELHKERPKVKSVDSFSSADEIKKYKELLDSGAITEEEYNAKKKQLLNVDIPETVECAKLNISQVSINELDEELSDSNSSPAAAEEETNSDTIDDFTELAATLIAEQIIANRNVEESNSADFEYGLIPNKPVYTAFIEGQMDYLNSLRTLDGATITWNRKGSMVVEGVNGVVDIYETYLPSGELYKTLYLNMYGTETSKIPPDGFKMRDNIETPVQTKATTSAPVSSAESAAQSTAHTVQNGQRFCKYCGGAIDSKTKKCNSCGKQFSHVSLGKVITAIVVLGVLFGVGGLFISTHNKGVEAMNSQQFILAQRYFDSLGVGELLYPEEYAYIAAGVLMENGDHFEAYKAFNNLDTPVPESITKNLKQNIYDAAILHYRANNPTAAKKYFDAIKDFKRSDDYLFLLDCRTDDISAYRASDRLYSLLGFEDAAKIIEKNDYCLQDFLIGRWETTSSYFYYFEIEEKDGGYQSWYNLPRESFYGNNYEINDGIYYQTNDNGEYKKFYKFSIINKDTIEVYCYKDENSYKLARQYE